MYVLFLKKKIKKHFFSQSDINVKGESDMYKYTSRIQNPFGCGHNVLRTLDFHS